MATCELTFTISPFAERIGPVEIADSRIVQSWRIRALSSTDPDFGNNESTVTYLLASPIPTLDAMALWIFSCGILAAYMVVRRRRAVTLTSNRRTRA